MRSTQRCRYMNSMSASASQVLPAESVFTTGSGLRLLHRIVRPRTAIVSSPVRVRKTGPSTQTMSPRSSAPCRSQAASVRSSLRK